MKKNKTIDYYIAMVITCSMMLVNVAFIANLIKYLYTGQYHCAIPVSMIGILFAILTTQINKELWKSKNS